MLNQLERFNQMSLFEKTQLLQWLSTFPALTLISWWRRDVGYRLLNPVWIGSTTLFMVAVWAFCPPESHPGFLLGFAGHTGRLLRQHRFLLVRVQAQKDRENLVAQGDGDT